MLLVAIARAPGFILLPTVDPYGDTMFNRLQVPTLILELERAESIPGLPPASVQLAREVIELGNTIADEPHAYLWFRGD
jgi:hypothetical protein